jgi:asparagine synthase (glutamine-hydrolysing)
MCGIAGVWSSHPIAEPAPLAERIDAALAHRGPDGRAWTVQDEGRLLLVHRRLAIIDPTPLASQPMSTADGRYTIIFNGEIYNHAQLRVELEREGERFASRSDTEVLLRLVARCGARALADVRGMFALGLWDSATRTLLAARDRFGIKPCYIASANGRIGVASEIRALQAAGFGDGVTAAGIAAYLRWGAIPAPLTWLRGVESVEPGTWVQWNADGRRNGRFADPRQLWSGARDVDAGELRARTADAIAGSVNAHLVSDVPVGIFLSGGIDSAALVAAACGRARKLHTFTVVFDEASHDEARHAACVAEQFDTEHHTLRVSSSDVVHRASALLTHLDQPTIDGVNTFFVSSAVAATGIKAVLSGIGGDEAFGGYPSFRRMIRGSQLGYVPRPFRVAAGHIGSYAKPSWRREKLRHAAATADSPFELYRAVRGWMMPAEIEAITGPALREATAVSVVDAIEDSLAAPVPAESKLATVARLETTMYLRQQLLRDADVMSMAHGLEVRVPFVDHQLIGTVWPALGSHPEMLAGKRLLVESLGCALPDAIVSRPKQGFTLPFEHWIDGPLADFVREGLRHAAREQWISRRAPDIVLRDWRERTCHWSRPWGLAVLGHFLARD